MKKLFFALVFVLGTSLSFANTKTNESQEVLNQVDGNIEVTLSCGVSGTLSWTGNPSTLDIIDAVQYFDDLLC